MKAALIDGGDVDLNLTQTRLEVSARHTGGPDLSMGLEDINAVAGAKFRGSKPILLVGSADGRVTCLRMKDEQARDLATSLRSAAGADRSGWAAQVPDDFSVAIWGRMLNDGAGIAQAGADCKAVIWGGGVTVSTPGNVSTIPWASVTAMTVEGVDQIRNRPRVGAVVMFGVFGLAARKKESEAFLTVTADHSEWVLEAQQILPAQLRARLRPALDHLSRHENAQSAEPPAGSEDEILSKIRQLAELRDDGVLSDEEFQAKKAELLARL